MENELTELVITSRSQVTPEWLTAVLVGSDALREGVVLRIEQEGGEGNWSENTKIRPIYTSRSKGTLPDSLFLKMVDAGSTDGVDFFDDSEVTYYTRDYVNVADAPLIHCYSAAFSAEQRRYHILLDDLSQTHVDATQKDPNLEHGLALAEGLAAMHARWWGPQRLTEAGAEMHSPDFIRRYVALAQMGLKHILSHFRSELKEHWPDMLFDFYDKHPALLIARNENPNGFTLIHGDVKKPNLLVPINGERPLYIIDRQPFNWSLTTWMGVYDLATAMVLDWESETRRSLEMQVLDHYFDWLKKKGVTGYSWDQLFNDFCLSMAMGIYTATEYCRDGINEPLLPVWLSFLKRTLTAIDDLEIYKLWK